MASRREKKQKQQLVGKIMDIFFDPAIVLSEEMHADLALWLLDENDSDLKEEHMMRKFDEIMESSDIGMPVKVRS